MEEKWQQKPHDSFHCGKILVTLQLRKTFVSYWKWNQERFLDCVTATADILPNVRTNTHTKEKKKRAAKQICQSTNQSNQTYIKDVAFQCHRYRPSGHTPQCYSPSTVLIYVNSDVLVPARHWSFCAVWSWLVSSVSALDHSFSLLLSHSHPTNHGKDLFLRSHFPRFVAPLNLSTVRLAVHSVSSKLMRAEKQRCLDKFSAQEYNWKLGVDKSPRCFGHCRNSLRMQNVWYQVGTDQAVGDVYKSLFQERKFLPKPNLSWLEKR